MSGDAIDTTLATWRPPLIRLTQIGNPDLAGGAPQPCYIDPQHIVLIYAALSSFNRVIEGDFVAGARHPLVPCTIIISATRDTLSVIETPEQVALVRDRALGHKPELKSA